MNVAGSCSDVLSRSISVWERENALHLLACGALFSGGCEDTRLTALIRVNKGEMEQNALLAIAVGDNNNGFSNISGQTCQAKHV